MPAILKNAIDWLSRVGGMKFFGGRPILLLSTSPGSNGGLTNLTNLATLVPWWGGDVVALYSLPRFEANFDRAGGTVTDAGHRAGLQDAAAALSRALDKRAAG
jgi:NAD(P)H-dependent FMN reductase